MLDTRNLFAQGRFIPNYNQLATYLIELGLYDQTALLDAKGICGGLSEIYILKNHEKRKNKFYNAIVKLTALTPDDFIEIKNILAPLINSSLSLSKNKLAVVADVFKHSNNPRIKQLTYNLLNFIDVIQKTQEDIRISNFSSISGNWDNTFSFSQQSQNLAALLDDYLNEPPNENPSANKKSQYFFCSLLSDQGSHAFVIKKRKDGSFVVYDPNADKREDKIILKNADELKDRILTIVKSLGFNDQMINMSVKPVSFGETNQNKILASIFINDDSLFQTFPQLNDLRIHYIHNDVSDAELIRLLQDWFKQEQNIKLTEDQLKTLSEWQTLLDSSLPLKLSSFVNMTDELLTLAIKNNEISFIKQLLKNFDVDHKNNEGLTLLHLAIFMNRADIAKYLIESGANINHHFTSKKHPEGISYLEYAIYNACLSKNQAEVDSFKIIIHALIDKGLSIQPAFIFNLEALKEKYKINSYATEIINLIESKFPPPKIEATIVTGYSL